MFGFGLDTHPEPGSLLRLLPLHRGEGTALPDPPRAREPKVPEQPGCWKRNRAEAFWNKCPLERAQPSTTLVSREQLDSNSAAMQEAPWGHSATSSWAHCPLWLWWQHRNFRFGLTWEFFGCLPSVSCQMCVCAWGHGRWTVENKIWNFLYLPTLPRLGSSLICLDGSVSSLCWVLEDVRSADILPLTKIRKLQFCVWDNLTMVRHGENWEVWKTDVETKLPLLCLLARCWKKSLQQEEYKIRRMKLSMQSSNEALFCCQCKMPVIFCSWESSAHRKWYLMELLLTKYLNSHFPLRWNWPSGSDIP